jgi:hypothetical protein
MEKDADWSRKWSRLMMIWATEQTFDIIFIITDDNKIIDWT